MNSAFKEKPYVACLINLGCAKNTVDSERILGGLVQHGWMIAADPADADICLVNTCGFVGDARDETNETLAELEQLKQAGCLKGIVALGCMVERAADVEDENWVLDGADLLVGFRDYPRLPKLCRELLDSDIVEEGGVDLDQPFISQPRMQTGYPHHAYLKISEGCSNRCSFCTIPAIRGPQNSRRIEDVVAEARELVGMGAREIEIIAQDTTSYGKDLYGERCLPKLLSQIAEIDTDCWFRLMYAYPPFLTERVLDIMAGDSRFCPYIDMPLQHISDDILRRMGRGMGRKDTVALLDRIEEKIPDVAIRTTFIAGYPGETEEDFGALLDFVEEGRFMHAGVFTYSRELKTRAARESDDVSAEEKIRRKDLLMKAQAEVSSKRLAKHVGKRLKVMFDRHQQPDSGNPIVGFAHTQWQEIDVDGFVAIVDETHQPLNVQPGDLLEVEILDSLDYDLVATPR